MTKNRAKKQAIRTRMQATGENYTQASHSSPVETITAWDDENGGIVIYGTHSASKALEAFQTYYHECGFKPGDPEWDPELDDLNFYKNMLRLWTLPKEEEDPFDMFTEPGPGRVPYMWWGGY